MDLNVDLQQGEWQGTSANLTGTGRLAGTTASKSYAAVISGNITDNSFTMKVDVGGYTLRYSGTVNPSGVIHGTMFNADSPASKVKWSSMKMKCADAAEKSSSSGSDDQHKKHKKKGGKHHHHDDDDQNQGND